MSILLLFSTGLFAQTTELTGTVTDASGSPIPQATIRIKGKNTGTSADMNGNFKISVAAKAVLIITAVGYESKEVATGKTNSLIVQLSQDTRSLSEVVVTGIGVATSKKKTAFAVEAVTADKLPPTPTASIDQALVGKIAGAQISSVNGTPGAPTSILLRGINTIQGGTKPLILLDGVEIYATDINSLDLSAVERVEVVQGAAAATIYGAQGANGVIQIFSKKGRKGQMHIDIASNTSLDQYINNGHFHKAMKHGFATNAAGDVVDGSGNPVVLDDIGVYQGVNWQYPAGTWVSAQANPLNMYNKSYDHNLKYYDHFKQLFGDGHSLNNSINMSGASDKFDYALGMSNASQSSAIRHNGTVSRTNLSANLGIELFKGFKLRSITQLALTKNTLHPYYGFGGNNIFNVMNVNPFYDLNKTLPNSSMYPFSYYPDNGAVSVNGYNPNYDFANTRSRNYKYDIIENLQANWTINKFVDLEAKYGLNYNQEDINWIFFNQSENPNVQSELSWEGDYNGSDATGEIDNFNYKTVFQNFLASAYFKTDFKRDFNINLPITTSTQFSYDYRKRRYSQYISWGYSLPSYPIYNMSQTSEQHITSDYVEPFVTYGFLVNQKIDFGDYGGISGGFRTDYSSAFGEGSKPFTFPRGDAYLRVSSFNFWQNSSLSNTISEFKLRAAYGEAGIQPGAFDRYVTLTPTNIGNALTFNLATAQKNPNLGVEVSKELEVGTDLTINGSKGAWFTSFLLSGTYWHRKGEHIIFDVSAAPSEGANTVKDNAIFLSSHGIQASLNMSVLKSKNLTWDMTTNFSKELTMVDKIIGGDIILTASAGSSSLVLHAGDPVGQIYGYKAIRNFNEKRLDGTSYFDQSTIGKYQFVNGMIVDTLTKAIQFTNDKYSLGSGNPKFNISFINSFSYKGFLTLGFQFDWIYGAHLYNQTKEWMYRDGIHSDYDDPVTINGQTAAYTAFYRSAYAAYFGDLNGAARNGTKDYFMEGSSFLRLRNVAIGFDFARVFKIPHFSRLQLVFTGRNIWTVTKYSGFDPELNSASGAYSSWDRGIDHNSMPNVKSYQVGLNVGL
ncbi:MAG TPA: SusC/RagA family TonB-linked outer membrane protein [Puia sp.]|nr:SusC/RagA family TonB-linked outer membrane protein [Puia sp.]